MGPLPFSFTEMKKLNPNFYYLIWLLSILWFSVSAQTEPLNTFQSDQEKLCTIQRIADKRSYGFRILPRTDQNAGGFGKTPWYRKVFPFLKTPAEKFGVDDIRALQKAFAQPRLPVGESKRSKKINEQIEQKLLEEQQQAEQLWQEWLKDNPTAEAEVKKQAELRIRYKGLGAALLPKYDWREQDLDVGEVDFQGINCESCWAFTSVDAIQISRRLAVVRSPEIKVEKRLQPSVRQLISCMVPENLYCQDNWHGKAFSFMVEKGLPLGGTDVYVANKSGHICDAEEYIKALTWDYLSVSPSKASSREEIKKAIITYGAVVSMVVFDKCLWMYGDGVFNEEQIRDGNHFVLIIGWDDTKGKKGAWLIKNSYGTTWGDQGFGWIEYESNNIGQVSAVVVADPKEEEKLTKRLDQKSQ